MKHDLLSSDEDSVSRETETRLTTLAESVLRWNKSVNLVSACDAANLWSRHILDSLQVASLIPASCQVAADLGSGGGFPGLVLAIATGIRFHLVEADKRKAAFLVHAAGLTNANVEVHACRIEECGLVDMPLVTSRALAPLARLLAYAVPLLSPAGLCVFLKGAEVSAELSAASLEWQMCVTRFASRTREGSQILRIGQVSRV